MTALKKKYPYKNNCAILHLHYLHNLLFITEYEPSLRKQIFSLIINKLVYINLNFINYDVICKNMFVG